MSDPVVAHRAEIRAYDDTGVVKLYIDGKEFPWSIHIDGPTIGSMGYGDGIAIINIPMLVENVTYGVGRADDEEETIR